MKVRQLEILRKAIHTPIQIELGRLFFLMKIIHLIVLLITGIKELLSPPIHEANESARIKSDDSPATTSFGTSLCFTSIQCDFIGMTSKGATLLS